VVNVPAQHVKNVLVNFVMMERIFHIFVYILV